MLSNRLSRMKPSATLALNTRAIELQAQGVDIIRFVTGESDLGAPLHVRKAAANAALSGANDFYTPTEGIKPLREAICKKFERDNQIITTPDRVIVTNGGKQGLFNCFGALLNSGDEVIIPSPYWVSYGDMVEAWDGVPKMIDTSSNQFKLTANQVEEALTPQTKIVILNSPSNPTGAVIDPEEIKKIAKLAKNKGFYVISDEVYEYFLYDDAKHFSIGSMPEIADQVITINAFSKTYGMTGWRVGYATGPKEVIKAMGTLQGHSTSNICAVAQQAALAALEGPQDCIQEVLETFNARRQFVYEALNAIPGITLEKPEGAFYAFPNISALYGKGDIHNSMDFANYLLEEAHVALAPGGAFGDAGDNYFRLSYAASMENLKKGIDRIRLAVEKLV